MASISISLLVDEDGNARVETDDERVLNVNNESS